MKKTNLKQSRAKASDTLEQRLWSNVDKSNINGCWLWLGATQKPGYGTLRVSGKKIFTHRLAYELSMGHIPPGLDICHTCDNPPCCNPHHLFLGTRAENIQDCASKGRIKRGSHHHSAKLNEEDVIEIRLLHQAKVLSQSQLTKKFNVSAATISEVINRKIWKHI